MSVTSKTGPCPICQTSVEVIEDLTEYRRVFSCPICGRLEFYPAVLPLRILIGITYLFIWHQWLPAK